MKVYYCDMEDRDWYLGLYDRLIELENDGDTIGEKVIEVKRDKYLLVGEDTEAKNVEHVFERWNNGSGSEAIEFLQARVCDECSQSFQSPDEAQAHEAEVHNEESVTHQPRSLSPGDIVETDEGKEIILPIGTAKAEWKK